MVDRASLGWQEEAEQITFWQGNQLKICVVITVGVLETVSCSVILIIKHCRTALGKWEYGAQIMKILSCVPQTVINTCRGGIPGQRQHKPNDRLVVSSLFCVLCSIVSVSSIQEEPNK